jgi:hypothetical protein
MTSRARPQAAASPRLDKPLDIASMQGAPFPFRAQHGRPMAAWSRAPGPIASNNGKLNSHQTYLSSSSNGAEYVSPRQDIARKTESPQRPAPLTYFK